MINEHEEFWRNKYATLLSKNKTNFNLGYLMPSGNPYGGEVVHRDSIGVIFYFARWPEDNDDPLHGVDVIEMYARGAIPIDFFGILGKLKKYEDALQAYDEVIKMAPDYTNAWFNKGVILITLGKHEEAQRLMNKLKSLNFEREPQNGTTDLLRQISDRKL